MRHQVFDSSVCVYAWGKVALFPRVVFPTKTCLPIPLAIIRKKEDAQLIAELQLQHESYSLAGAFYSREVCVCVGGGQIQLQSSNVMC